MSAPTELQRTARRAHTICDRQDWGRDWSNGGCYLHLEVSEFIEGLRGKGDPLEEAGDVVFVLLSMLVAAGLDPEEVLRQCHRKMDGMDAEASGGDARYGRPDVDAFGGSDVGGRAREPDIEGIERGTHSEFGPK